MTNDLCSTACDLSNVVTVCAQKAATVAVKKGLGFFFDYRGPSFDVAAHVQDIQHILTSLLSRAIDALANGMIFVSVDVTAHNDKRATVLFQVADTGRLATSAVMKDFMSVSTTDVQEGTSLSEQALTVQLTPIEDEIGAVCRRLQGELIVGSIEGEGNVSRADLLLNAPDIGVDTTIAAYHGLEAWLIGKPPVIFESLLHRVQRLGWKVRQMPSIASAKALMLTQGPPDLAVAVERYNVSLEDFLAFAEALATSATAFVTACPGHEGSTGDRGHIGQVQIVQALFSPQELYRITERALKKVNKVLQAPVSAQSARRLAPKALLVDDNPINQLLSTEILRFLGFDVDVAGNGKDAVTYYQTEAPAVVIMDVNMPIMDGIEATRLIRQFEQEGELPRTPILISSALSDAEIGTRAEAAGADGFVPKPIDIPQMQQALSQAMKLSSFDMPVRSAL
jgi:CheY-like chemotaxis protein